MQTRGRKSAASLEVPSIVKIDSIQRPNAPYDLAREEAEVWWTLVNSKPADWFPSHTHGLLKFYCRHSVNADRLALQLNLAWAEAAPDYKKINKLSAMFERDTRAMSALATRMRVSQHSTYDAKRKGTTPTLEYGSYIR